MFVNKWGSFRSKTRLGPQLFRTWRPRLNQRFILIHLIFILFYSLLQTTLHFCCDCTGSLFYLLGLHASKLGIWTSLRRIHRHKSKIGACILMLVHLYFRERNGASFFKGRFILIFMLLKVVIVLSKGQLKVRNWCFFLIEILLSIFDLFTLGWLTVFRNCCCTQRTSFPRKSQFSRGVLWFALRGISITIFLPFWRSDVRIWAKIVVHRFEIVSIWDSKIWAQNWPFVP